MRTRRENDGSVRVSVPAHSVSTMTWSVEYDGDAFERFFVSLPDYEQAVVGTAITHVLAIHGIDVCAGEWGKPLGKGLYEFRIRRSRRHASSTTNGSGGNGVDRVCLGAHTGVRGEESWRRSLRT